MSYPHLFSPWSLAGRPLRNRVIQSAMTSNAARGGGVTERLLNQYQARARGGTALLVTEALACHRGQDAPARIAAHSEAQLEGLKRWAGVVEAHGGALVGQMYDPGRGRHHPGRSRAAIGASALPDDLSWTVPRPLSPAAIAGLVAELAETAHRLLRAGFAGTELSCGHGHLLHQFLSPQANHRDDAYGGDTVRRTRLVRELIAAIRAACGPGFILGLKLVGDDGVPGGVDEAEASRILPLLTAPGMVDYVAPVRGAHHRTLEMHMPDRSYPALPYRGMLNRLRPFAGETPVVAIARITMPDEAEMLLAGGECAAVMLGRAPIADAAWAEKARTGRTRDIRPCISCNTCWETTTEGKPIACDVNPRLGLPGEADWQPVRAAARRRVVVVGAGIAGLEAAWIAARRGHDVIVFGASAAPGGAAALNAALPGCAQVGRTVDFQMDQARRAGVAFRLGTAATAADVLALAPDAVVLACGSRMIRPPALAPDGGASDLRAALRALLAVPGPRAGTAVLFDQDHTAGTYDAAEFLAATYERFVLLTPRERIASDVALVVRQRIQARIHGRRIPVITFAELAGFDAGAVHWRDVNTGDVDRIGGVSLLAYSTPRVPDDTLAAALSAAGIAFHVVGDCAAPRATMAAIAEGQEAGNAV